MKKNLILAIGILSLVVAAIGWAIYADPERHDKLLFKQALRQFASQSQVWEAQFTSESKLPQVNQTLTLNYLDRANVDATMSVKISTRGNRVVMQFGDGDTLLAQQTVALVPKQVKGQVVWQCLEGSLLIRVRSKNCRLGKGFTRNQLL